MLLYLSSLRIKLTPSSPESFRQKPGAQIQKYVSWAFSFKLPPANNVLIVIRWVCRKQMEVELGQVVRKYTEEKEKNDEVRPPADALICSEVLG
jgi:hypothetical protein